MPLARKRCEFSIAFANLLMYARIHGKYNGYIPAYGELKRHKSDTHGHPNSLHYDGLAGHIIIYTPDYDWPHPRAKEIYDLLHDEWDRMGGAQRIENDENHFSFAHRGMR